MGQRVVFCRRMQIKGELKAPADQPTEPAAAEPVDSEEEAETHEAAVLEEMQVQVLWCCMSELACHGAHKDHDALRKACTAMETIRRCLFSRVVSVSDVVEKRGSWS